MSVYGWPNTHIHWGSTGTWIEVSCPWAAGRQSKDNNDQVAVGLPEYDKLFKIRPLWSWLLRSFKTIPNWWDALCGWANSPFQGKECIEHFLCWQTKMEFPTILSFTQVLSLKKVEFQTLEKVGTLYSVIPPQKRFYDNWFCGIDLQMIL